MESDPKNLNQKVVWVFFIMRAVPLTLVFLFFAALIAFPAFLEGEDLSLILIIVGVFAALVVINIIFSYFWSLLTYKNYLYDLREDGFRKEHGVINKKYVTIPYERIQNVDIHRNLVDRLFGLSRLKIQTAGGIGPGSYGAMSEGYLPGLDYQVAEQLRDELIRRSKGSKESGV